MADKRREGEEARKRGLPLPINFLIPYEDAQPSMYRLDWFNKKTLNATRRLDGKKYGSCGPHWCSFVLQFLELTVCMCTVQSDLSRVLCALCLLMPTVIGGRKYSHYYNSLTPGVSRRTKSSRLAPTAIYPCCSLPGPKKPGALLSLHVCTVRCRI